MSAARDLSHHSHPAPARAPEPTPAADDRIACLEKARAYIERAFRRNPTLPDIAAVSFLSPFHFHRLFRAHYGKTPKQLVTELQIEEVQRLARGGVTLLDAARQAGFAHQSHMTTRFKKLVGKTPGQWLTDEGIRAPNRPGRPPQGRGD